MPDLNVKNLSPEIDLKLEELRRMGFKKAVSVKAGIRAFHRLALTNKAAAAELALNA